MNFQGTNSNWELARLASEVAPTVIFKVGKTLKLRCVYSLEPVAARKSADKQQNYRHDDLLQVYVQYFFRLKLQKFSR